MNIEFCENVGIKNINIIQDKPDDFETDVLICPLTEERLKDIREGNVEGFKKELSEVLKISFFKAELCEVDMVPNTYDAKPRNILFLGLEKEANLSIEKLRKAYAEAIQHLKFSRVKNSLLNIILMVKIGLQNSNKIKKDIFFL